MVIPRAAGVASAIGLITSDLAAERVLTRLMPTDEADPAVVAAVFAELEELAVKELPGGEASWSSAAPSRPDFGDRPTS